MSVKNPWLTPYQRSYQDIKKELIQKLVHITDSNGEPYITDVSEGNILIILISMFAAIAEVLHYYIDCAARESFFVTARKYDSLVKHAAFVDYHPKGAVAATVDLQCKFPNITGFIGDPTSTTIVDDSQHLNWMLAHAISSTSRVITLIQHEPYTIDFIQGMVISENNSNMHLDLTNFKDYYEDGTMQLEIDNEPWTLVDTFAYSSSIDKHFRVEINEDGIPTIIFGDGVFGKLPPVNSTITKATCYITQGSSGNVPAGSFSTNDITFVSGMAGAEVTNAYPAAGGSNYESFEDLQTRVPLQIRTQGVAVSAQDFEDLAKMTSGIQDAKVEALFGKSFNLFIKPYENPSSSEVLIKRLHDKLDKFLPIGTSLNIEGVGQVNINLTLEIMGRKGFTRDQIQTAIIEALQNKYSWETSQIGGAVRVSDIYALVDNLPSVDYLHLKAFSITPWPIVITGGISLNITSFQLTKCEKTTSYYLYINNGKMDIRSLTGGFYKTGINLSNEVSIQDDQNGVEFKGTFTPSSLSSGKFQITVTVPNEDYVDPGYNVPVFDPTNSQLYLTINVQS